MSDSDIIRDARQSRTMALAASEDAKEARTAMPEKRKPVFKGR